MSALTCGAAEGRPRPPSPPSPLSPDAAPSPPPPPLRPRSLGRACRERLRPQPPAAAPPSGAEDHPPPHGAPIRRLLNLRDSRIYFPFFCEEAGIYEPDVRLSAHHLLTARHPHRREFFLLPTLNSSFNLKPQGKGHGSRLDSPLVCYIYT